MSATPRTDTLMKFVERLGTAGGEDFFAIRDSVRCGIEDMERSLSEAVSDTKRLDWLQLHREDLAISRDLRPGSELTYVDCNVTGTLGHGDSLRAAIDAAMKAEAA